MAAITGAVIAAGTAAYSVSQSVKAAKEKKAAAAAINAQKAPELQNAGEQLQVSTLGSDLQKEEQGRLAASQVQAAQEAGTRGVIGSVGKIAAQNQNVNAQTAADLDQQQKEIDYFKAQDTANIRGIKDQRFRDKLAALSSQYNSANQMQQQSMGNAISATGSALGSLSTLKTNTGFQAPQTGSNFPESVSNTNYGNTAFANKYLYK
jgi:hypothetical protein